MDDRLRTLQRAWRTSGSADDARAYLRALLRCGSDLPASGGPEVAFVAGHLLGEATPTQSALVALTGLEPEKKQPGLRGPLTGVAHVRTPAPDLDPTVLPFLITWLESLTAEEQTLLLTVDLLCEPAIPSRVRREVYLSACAAQGLTDVSYAEQQLVALAHVLTEPRDMIYVRPGWLAGGPPFGTFLSPRLRHPAYRWALEVALPGPLRPAGIATLVALFEHEAVRRVTQAEFQISAHQLSRHYTFPGAEAHARDVLQNQIRDSFELLGAGSLLRRVPMLMEDPCVQSALRAVLDQADLQALRGATALVDVLDPPPTWLEHAFWRLADRGEGPVDLEAFLAGVRRGFESPYHSRPDVYPRIGMGLARSSNLETRLGLAMLWKNAPNPWPELSEVHELLRADQDPSLREVFEKGWTSYWDYL